MTNHKQSKTYFETSPTSLHNSSVKQLTPIHYIITSHLKNYKGVGMEIQYKSSQINIIILVAVCCKSSMPLKEIQRYVMEWKYVSKFVEIQLIVLLVAACWKQLMQWFADSSHPFWPHNSNLHSFDSSSSLSLSSLSNH